MTILSISERDIRQGATPESFGRGKSYAAEGAVHSLILRGNQLQAEVVESGANPSTVYVTLADLRVTEAWCSCPYDLGGWCKHIVAVLLACLREPDQIEVRVPLEEILADLDEGQLRALILDLAEHNPRLTESIEAKLSAPVIVARNSPQIPPVDVAPIRRQVHAALHSLDRMRSSEAYWHVGSVVNEVGQILQYAWQLIGAGDGVNALRVLEAITEAYLVDCWNLDDSDGYVGGFFSTLGEAWTEAALTANLSERERKAWVDRLAELQSEVSEYGVDDVFSPAQAAFLMGWEDPALQRVLKGEGDPLGVWGDARPWYAAELTVARLKVLDRQGRHEEYLHLARAEGQEALYVLMLARTGRTDEALREGIQYLQDHSAILNVARALHQQGEVDAALRLAEHGLSVESRGPYAVSSLAAWTSQIAFGAGRLELALSATVMAFQASPGLDSYRRVAALAGERWPEVREEVLTDLRKRSGGPASDGAVDVFLDEGLLDDAIKAAEAHEYNYTLVEKVVDAILQERPGWAAEMALRQAARIIEPGKAQHYGYAINWLRRARDAFRIAGREPDWRAYVADLRERHGRKYKLMGMLKGLV